MADPDMDEDLFADLYDGEADEIPETAPEPVKTESAPLARTEPQHDSVDTTAEVAIEQFKHEEDINVKPDTNEYNDGGFGGAMQGMQQQQYGGDHNNGGNGGGYGGGGGGYPDDNERPIGIKEDGKMFIGGLNWETTDESLKTYFSQFGEVVECTVMRDGATGRSRGFGFLTFRDPKTVNTVMVKEHSLDNKLIDPKRAIPRDEQERTAKIFVGGVSQEATETDFKQFFDQFGRVLDATLMMDKDTGRPRGFGFVTFDNESAVDRTLEGPLAIRGKAIEVKRAQPRGNMREEEMGGRNGGAGGKFGGRGGGKQDFNGSGGGFGGNPNQMPQGGGGQGGQGGENNMSPAMMAQYWQRMQQYFAVMQSQMQAANAGPMGGMNPQMMQMMQQRGMNPQMMQQMQAMQAQQGGGGGFQGQNNNAGGGSPGGGQGYNAQEQLMFEQQKCEQQSRQRMQGTPGAFNNGGGNNNNGGGGGGNGNTWDGMYDDVPPPTNMQGGGGRGNFGGGGRGRGGRNSQGTTPQPGPGAAPPAGAPTGPKNAGRPGANYRGGGRGGAQRGFHPYGGRGGG